LALRFLIKRYRLLLIARIDTIIQLVKQAQVGCTTICGAKIQYFFDICKKNMQIYLK
jgi:hypothetical protein